MTNFSQNFQEWELEAENGGKIRLTFEHFDIEPKTYNVWQMQTICNDYVEVSYDSFSEKFCGITIPGPFTSTGDSMTVKFHSDALNNRPGFRAVWTEIL